MKSEWPLFPIVSALTKEVLEGRREVSPLFAELARRTGHLPVYCDMGGAILLGRDGTWYLSTDERTEVVFDERSIMLGRISAARHYGELAGLVPPRPHDALDCAACRGTGALFGTQCGTCLGLGWCAP